VRALIRLPLEHYDGFIAQCDPSLPGLLTLYRGEYIRFPSADRYTRTIEIDCPIVEAKRLLNLAKRVYPEAVPYIEQAIAKPLDLLKER